MAARWRIQCLLLLVCLAATRFDTVAQPTPQTLIDRARQLLATDSAGTAALLDSAARILAHQPSFTQQVRLDIARSTLLARRRKHEQALATLSSALEAAAHKSDNALLLEAYAAQGYIYRQHFEYYRAIDAQQRSLSLATTLMKPLDQAQAAYELGINYRQLSAFDSAMTYFYQALQLFEELDRHREMIHTYRHIGNVYLQTHELNLALNIFRRSETLIQSRGDSTDMAANLLNTGAVYQKLKDYKTARSYFRKCLAWSSRSDYLTKAICYGNIGSSLMEEGRMSEGLPYLMQALQIKREHHASPGSVMHTLLDISDCYRRMGQYTEAIDFANQTLEISRQHGDLSYRRYALLYLSRIYAASDNYRQAYTYHLQYSHLNDSLFDAERSRQIKELEVSYESEKKDRAISDLEQSRLLERAQKERYLLLGVLVLLGGGLLWNFQRIKTKRQRQLLEQEQELDRIKSNFFANISHEFRTPLTLLLGPIQSKLATATDADEIRELRMMERNALRLQRLITDILDMSKLREGQLKLQPKAIDLIHMLRGVAMSFDSLAKSAGITYQVNLPLRSLPAYIDRDKVETVLINLLSNAFKFTPAGGRVTLAVQTGPEEQVVLAISDSGCGIHPEQLSRIFDRFYQAEDAQAHRQGGTGIGLAFTKELVQLMGGSISVSSSPGSGSNFEVRLPLQQSRAKELLQEQTAGGGTPAKPLPHAPAPATAPKAPSNSPLVLVVDDHEDVRYYIASILGSQYRLLLSRDGAEGLAQAAEHMPDLIISDVMMPRMDGYQLTQALKNDVRTSHIPLMLLTAKASGESRIKGLSMEADVYMAKPFNAEELKLQVRNLLRLKEAQRKHFRTQQGDLASIPTENPVEKRFHAKLQQALEDNYSHPEFGVEELSREVGMSRSHLHRKLQSISGESASKLIRNYRLRIARQKLAQFQGSISEVAYQVGFNDVPYFNKCFKEHFGCTPSELVNR